jgi:hypothetical protein
MRGGTHLNFLRAVFKQHLLPEEFGMAAGSRQLQFSTLRAIEEQPIGLDVQITKPIPVSAQCVIAIAGWKGLSFKKEQQYCPKLC